MKTIKQKPIKFFGICPECHKETEIYFHEIVNSISKCKKCKQFFSIED